MRLYWSFWEAWPDRAEQIPAIYSNRDFVEPGGLMAYSPDLPDIFRSVAKVIDKTAKVLGLEMPAMLLSRADEVVE
jgi:putative ABC transport system substrate-binding protein